MNDQFRKIIQKFQQYADRWWYAPILALLAILDNVLLIIPCDGIMLASTVLQPRRWSIFTIFVTIGSTLGAFALCLAVEHQGLPWVLKTFVGIDKTFAWIWTEKFFSHYGLIIVFLICASPIMQQPVIILATLSKTPLTLLISIIFIGKLIKYLFLGYIASNSPKYLTKLWGIQDEIKDVGIK